MRVANARGYRNVGKRGVAVVAEQNIGTIGREIKILIAVVVVVADADSHAPTALHEARLARDVHKRSAVVLVQGDHRISALFIVLQRRAVDDQDVHVAVVVVIKERGTVSIRLDDVVFGGSAADVHQRDPNLRRHINEGRKLIRSEKE